MTTLDAPAPPITTPQDAHPSRLGAALGIAAVVLMLAGLAIEAPADAVNSNPAEQIVGYYTGEGMARKIGGGLVVALGLLLLLPFVATLAERLRAPGAAAVLAATAQAAAVVHVTISLAPGQAAGAAALSLGRDGTAEATAVLALNDLRAASYFLSMLPLALLLVALGAAALRTGRLPRWAGWSAVGMGTALVVAVPLAETGAADIASLLAFVWIIAVSVSLLRRPAAHGQGTAG